MGPGLWVEGLVGESVTLENLGTDKSVGHLRHFLCTGLATMSPIWKKSPKGRL